MLNEIVDNIRTNGSDVAVIDKGVIYTYSEIESFIGRQIEDLCDIPSGNGRVGIYMEPGIEMVSSIHGIIMSGRSYVPLNPELPAERLQEYTTSLDLSIVITLPCLLDSASRIFTQCTVLTFDKDNVPQIPIHKISVPSFACEQEVYTLFTSGSTGEPKGVAIPLRALSNHLNWKSQTYGFGKQTRLLFKTPFNFDASVWEIFMPFYCGGTMVIAPSGSYRAPDELAALIEQHNVSVLQVVPTLLREMASQGVLSKCASLEHLFVGGESLDYSLCLFVQKAIGTQIHNLYGPTESCIDTLSWTFEPNDNEVVYLGSPVANVNVKVVDEYGNLIVGEGIGELWITGQSLALGYVQKSSAKPSYYGGFEGPCESNNWQCWYRTGDWVELTKLGIVFHGRVDRQIKLNGQRIDLQEIEKVITKLTDIEHLYVAKYRFNDHDHLACYFVGSTVEVPLLCEMLRSRLPHYMIPTYWSVTDTLPILVSGKLDINSFERPKLAMEYGTGSSNDNVTLTQKLLINIWSEMLNISPDKIKLTDSFFELGGTSVQLSVLRKKIKNDSGITLKMTDFFRYPNINKLSNYLDSSINMPIH